MKYPSQPDPRRPLGRALHLAVGAALIGGAALVWFGRPHGGPVDAHAAAPMTAAPTNPTTAALAATATPASPVTPSTPALTVEVTTPQAQTLPRTVAASGSVAARDELLIGSDAQGVRLIDVRVEVGAVVQAGELLARGDDAALRAQLAQQDALVRQAEAQRAQADANLERAERVQDSGLYSAEALQTRRTAAQSAAAQLDLARAQRRETELRIARARVRSPAAGVIARRSASVGLVMEPGVELFRLIRDGRLDWLAELPDHALAQVKVGAPVRIALDGGAHVDGRVRLVEPTIDPHSRNGRVHVELPPGAPLKPGAHASGEIEVARAPALTLPESVVFDRDGQRYVYAVGADEVARLTRIETGAARQGRVEVTGGLAPDARVASTGAGFLKDGERVRVAPGGSAAVDAGPVDMAPARSGAAVGAEAADTARRAEAAAATAPRYPTHPGDRAAQTGVQAS